LVKTVRRDAGRIAIQLRLTSPVCWQAARILSQIEEVLSVSRVTEIACNVDPYGSGRRHDRSRSARAAAEASSGTERSLMTVKTDHGGFRQHRVPAVERMHRSRFIEIDGIRTQLSRSGRGPAVVLLHSGEFGGCAELSWEYMIPPARPALPRARADWLGFGQTAKIHDFDGKRARMVSHLIRFVETMALDVAHFVGNSMGATYLLQMAAERPCRLPIDRLVAISGGGFIPDNEERRRLLDYTGTASVDGRPPCAIFESPSGVGHGVCRSTPCAQHRTGCLGGGRRPRASDHEHAAAQRVRRSRRDTL